MKAENAIEVRNLKKKFKVYYDKGNSLKEKIESSNAILELSKKIQKETENLQVLEEKTKEKNSMKKKIDTLITTAVQSMDFYKQVHQKFSDDPGAFASGGVRRYHDGQRQHRCRCGGGRRVQPGSLPLCSRYGEGDLHPVFGNGSRSHCRYGLFGLCAGLKKL